MTRTRTNPDFLNGVPELLILEHLTRRPMYGYELVRAIEESSGQQFQFGEGCIYPLLHRLEEAGHLSSKRETVAGRSRVIYRVTAPGKRKLAETVESWQRVVNTVNHILQGHQDGLPAVS